MSLSRKEFIIREIKPKSKSDGDMNFLTTEHQLVEFNAKTKDNYHTGRYTNMRDEMPNINANSIVIT